MARSSEKRYSSGEFAREFGVKKDTLLYYDKIGLFRPAGVQQNGYRYYTAAQGAAFGALHALRQMNVPIADLRGYFASPSPAALGQLACAQLAAVEREMAQLARMRWLLQQMAQATREGLSAPMGEVTLCELPAQRLFCSGRNAAAGATSVDEWSRQYEVFLTQLGLKGSAYIGSVIAQADLEAGRFARVERLFVRDDAGLFGAGRRAQPHVSGAQGQSDAPAPAQASGSAKKTAAQKRGGSPRAAYQPAGRYAVFYCRGNYDRIQEYYPFVLSEIARSGLRVCGDAYEEYLIYELATADTQAYVTKTSIPVEENPGGGLG